MIKPTPLDEQQDFSLVLGGPLFRLFRLAHLSGGALELMRRRMLVVAGVAWVPLLLLSAASGHASGGAVEIPFLHDVAAHLRFLVSLPILIGAELVVHRRLRPIVSQFQERRIIAPEELPQFNAAIHSTARLRNSVVGEAGLLVFVYTVGLWVWRTKIVQESASWYAIPGGGQLRLTPAGYWYVFVSTPIFQFVLVRWYLRLLLWATFLWRVSRLDLRLVPIHPDRAAGLGFLGMSTYAFSPILFAQGVLLAGLIATQIFHEGQDLMSFKVKLVGLLIFFLAIMLGPLTVFTPHLARAKRLGLGDFGRLASRYAQAFEEKWLRAGASADGEILGSGDIQSLADLGNSFAVVQEMRIVPFGWKDVTRLAGAVIVPLLPLLFTVFSLAQLVDSLISMLV